jgi:hypothetical protein
MTISKRIFKLKSCLKTRFCYYFRKMCQIWAVFHGTFLHNSRHLLRSYFVKGGALTHKGRKDFKGKYHIEALDNGDLVLIIFGYDMIWYDMIWYDMIWYDMIWYDMIWYYVRDMTFTNKRSNIPLHRLLHYSLLLWTPTTIYVVFTCTTYYYTIT